MFKVARDFLPILGLEVNVKRFFNIAKEILGLYYINTSPHMTPFRVYSQASTPFFLH
jgi:hypothetical protein